MSSISLSLRMMLAVGAGVTMLACGDDSGSGDDTTAATDAGTHNDATSTTTTSDAATTSGDAATANGYISEGEACDPTAFRGLGGIVGECQGCSSAQCLALCEHGVYGTCENVSDVTGALVDGGISVTDILSVLGDAGTATASSDGGFASFLRDGGFTFNTDAGARILDSGIPVAACPAQDTCTTAASGGVAATVVRAVGVDVGFCTSGASAAPQACTTSADCAAYGVADCFDAASAGQETALALSLIGWPAQFCIAPCEP